jgi:hypothetical protein
MIYMIKIFYLISKTITIPGTLLKAFLEHIACRLTLTAMDNDRYYQNNEMCGHVEHDLAEKRGQAFVLCFFPFIIMLIFGIIFAWAGSIDIIAIGEFRRNEHVNLMGFFYLYLGLCFLNNLFPSTEDYLSFKELFYGKGSKNIFLKIILAPLFALFFIGTKLEKTGLSLITTAAFIFFMPQLLSLFVPQLTNLVSDYSA